MQMLLLLASLASFCVAAYAWWAASTDIHLAIVLIGGIGGFVLLGLAMVVGRIADLQRVPPLPDSPAPKEPRRPAQSVTKPRRQPRPAPGFVERREPHF